MAGLNQEMLFTACRAIYEMAGENYALPPLIRDAESLETQPGYRYKCLLGKQELYFLVELDESCADRNALANSKLPLKFHVELHDPSLDEPVIEITGLERYELIRAFLLGAKLPIFADNSREKSAYKVYVQLSSTFFADCGEFSDERIDCFFNAICDNVGRRIYERSKEFFDDPSTGLAVWNLLAAQNLFGEKKPAPETLWPHLPEDTVAVASSPVENASESRRSHSSRYAVAATIIIGLLGTGGVTANFGLGEGLTPETVVGGPRFKTGVARPEWSFVTSAQANDAFGSLRPSGAWARGPGATAEHHIKVAQLRLMRVPASAAVPAAADLPTVSAQGDCPVCGLKQWSQVAPTVSAPIPPTATAWLSLPPKELRAPARPKWALAARRKSRHRDWRPAGVARAKPLHLGNPLKFTRNALASVTSAVKDNINRIPDAISKAKKRLQVLL